MAATDELRGFVREALVRGTPRADVDAVLTRAGWNAAQVRGVLDEFADLPFPIPVPRPRPTLDARDAFLYFVLFATLYTSAFHLGSLIFEFINRAFPDPAFASADPQYATVAVRWSIAALVIALPVFLWVSTVTARAVRHDPAKRNSKARLWLTYLTLSIAAVVLIGDFITLVFYLLGGELSVRFVLKALTVALIGGGVFLYYLMDIRPDERGGA
jgi:hypothetical protein